ncbi:MAG: helix-turn-helix transcriptional regulator [Thermoplasmata archaeon]
MRKIIKAIRQLNGLTLQEVANYVGVNKSAVGNFESGLTTLSNLTISKICDLLGIDYEKKRFKSENIYYFQIKSDKDWVDFEYLQYLSDNFIKISEIVHLEKWSKKNSFVHFTLLYESNTENIYVLLYKKPCKKDIVYSAISSIFPHVVNKFEYVTEDLENLIKSKKAKREDLLPYFYFTYCYQSRRIRIETGNTITYVHEVPIDIILGDFFRYIKHEKNLERKKRYIEKLISEVLLKLERPVTEEEYKKELERRLKGALELFRIPTQE